MIRVSSILLAGSLSLMLSSQPANADDAQFAELLARAHAEVGAGSQAQPLGKNVTETFMAMINILPQASAQQLAEFDALLQQQKAALAATQNEPPGQSGPPGADTAMTPVIDDQGPRLPQSTAIASVPARPAKPPVEAATLTMPAPVTSPPVNNPPVASAPITSPPITNPQITNPPAAGVRPREEPPTPPQAASRPAPAPAALPDLSRQLYARGQAAEKLGDISGARRYYRAAAEQNNAAAAQSLAQL